MNPRIKQPHLGKAGSTGPSPAELLAKIPRRPMTAEQQNAALEKVQQQATQRVKLGQQLFEAADAKLKEHQQVLDEINQQQQRLREQVQEDVAKSLQSYDQWMGKIDESFTGAIKDLNGRIDQLELRFDASRGEMHSMMEKAAALLNQTQGLLAEAFDDEAEIAQAMQQSVPQDPHMDLDELGTPSIDTRADHEDDAEVIEVEIVEPADPMPIDEAEASAGEDVFGEVLRRLRSQQNDGEGGHAAA